MSSLVSFPFSVFVVSISSTKLLHLYIHATTIPALDFVLYLPTFFIPDALLICASRLLLRRERGVVSLLGLLMGMILTLVTLGAASSHIGFWWKTGGEMEWEQARTYANSADGMQVLLSESLSVLLAGTSILVFSWFMKSFLYRLTGNFLLACGNYIQQTFTFISMRLGLSSYSPVYSEHYTDEELAMYYDGDSDVEDMFSATSSYLGQGEKEDGHDEESLDRSNRPVRRFCSCLPAWLVILGVMLYFIVALSIRPAKPYIHMSTTLPIPLMDILKSKPDFCAEQTRLHENEWPLLELVENANWQKPNKDFKGWAPGGNNNYIKLYRERKPEWLPSPVPDGFHRWDPASRHNITVAELNSKHNGTFVDHDSVPEENDQPKCPHTVVQDDDYNPVDDPLRISNLDLDVLQPLRQALGSNSVKIKHVALIQMESLREELFPLQQGSDIHKMILESHDEDERDEVNERLSRLTPNAEKITGKRGGFMSANGTKYEPAKAEWDYENEDGFGGVNVVGAHTGSSVSTKSVVGSHCGVWPMPVDFLEEAESQSYQPCLPQVLDLFNKMKARGKPNDMLEQPWRPVFFQATTDEYDRQDVFNKKMGFEQFYTKSRLEKDAIENSDLDFREINYFGYPEQNLKGYMKDEIMNATKNNERLFFSHFTSTTHHPWDTPDWFETQHYMGKHFTRHKDFDKYLNTIRFHDAWLGELLQMFDDLEIADETLIVFVGDHGQAFKEDVSKTGTFENGHVSNFRVPITFRHPRLPRVQYEANATSISLLPTILDLLINTNSLNIHDTTAAKDLVNDYEGQSLIRPYKTSEAGRRAWNFGIVNSGGGMLAVTSADGPWRLVLPLEMEVEYAFTDLEHDPLEKAPTKAWTIDGLVRHVRGKFGPEAAEWADEAELVARWWAQERKRLWKYAPSGSD